MNQKKISYENDMRVRIFGALPRIKIFFGNFKSNYICSQFMSNVSFIVSIHFTLYFLPRVRQKKKADRNKRVHFKKE